VNIIQSIGYSLILTNFFLYHHVQNGSGVYPASYPMGNRGFFPGVKRPGREADNSPPSSAEVKECVELYLQSPNTPAWSGAQLNNKHRVNFTLLLTNKKANWPHS
jgi:hypothetical protein